VSTPTFTGAESDRVELRMGASARHLSAVRALAADLAYQLDMNLDAVSDLRLAVDEACSALVRLAAPDSVMTCRFAVSSEKISVRVSVPSEHEQGPSQRDFSWQVLTTLADDVQSEVTNGPHRCLVSIELTKSAAEQL
jgi:serine/threonine-protein kinase RsbW